MAGLTDEEEPMMLAAEAKQGPRPWRRLGLAVVAVGTIGAAVGVMTRPAQLTPMERAAVMAKSFMRGFSKRRLTALEGAFACDASFKWVADEAEGDPDAMSVTAKFAQREKQHPHMQIRASIKAKEGMAQELHDHIVKVKEAGVKLMSAQMGPDAANGMADQMLKIVKTANGVDVTVLGPPPDENMTRDFKEGLGEGTPEMSASLAVGRDFDGIIHHLDESVLTIFNGLKASLHTSVAKRIIAGMEEMAADSGEMSDEMKAQVKAMEALSSFSEETTIKYRNEVLKEETAGMAIRQLPKLGPRELPAVLAPPLKALKDYADGLTEVDFIGLPEKWGLSVQFTNFHVTQVLDHIIPDEEESNFFG